MLKYLALGGVTALSHLQSISMNLLQQYTGLEVLPTVFGGVFDKCEALKRPCRQQYKGGFAPLTPHA